VADFFSSPGFFRQFSEDGPGSTELSANPLDIHAVLCIFAGAAICPNHRFRTSEVHGNDRGDESLLTEIGAFY